ncbi:DUF1775 domain-containing protein [Streptomyces adustus]|uniref:DUF1775 domain-containing protein n=1 Tax=Streptomyces adustus TaxID=1609272 RepID=A0A5N8VDD1_9ACTN|nr:DUF1775 domain-containing protein [Streptomyces adustus]
MFRVVKRYRTARHLPLAAAAAACAVLLSAGPAAAHVEVESEKAQALAENVEISFDAESESDTAGITQIRVVLPEGIAPADVTYGKGPQGWQFSVSADGYTVKGPALRTGVDAAYSVVVRQLPDAGKLAFKTLQTYTDGRTDRWIELDENGENPAPTLRLKAAAPGAKPVAPSPTATPETTASASASPAPAAEGTAASPSPQAAEAERDDDGLSAGVWAGIVAAVLAAAAGVAVFVRRRGGDEG